MGKETLVIMPHAYKHGLSEDEILYAWNNPRFRFERDDDPRGCVIVAVGPTNELSDLMDDIAFCAGIIAQRKEGNVIYIFHANRPPVPSLIRELKEWMGE